MFRDSNQQFTGNQPSYPTETPKHCGAKGSGGWKPFGKVKHEKNIYFPCLNMNHFIGLFEVLYCIDFVGSPISLFLVMSYCEQDLASLLENMQSPFSEAQV